MLAGVGAILLALSIFGGDADSDVDLDVGDTDFDISDAEAGVDSPGIFSLKFLSTFALVFGLAGIVVSYQGGGVAAQLIWGGVLGMAVAGLYFLIMKFMYSMQGSSLSTAASLIGKIGTITIPTTDTGKGQVRVAAITGMTEYGCIEKDSKKLKQNDQVVVTSVVDAGTLIVEKEER